MAEETQSEIAALTARVQELERQVGLLTRAATAFGERPLKAVPLVVEDRVPPPPVPEIPPRVPAAAPMQQTAVSESGRDQSLENRLGSQVFNLIGIVAILVGTSWFLKLAIERGWIGFYARVLIGLVAGAGLVLWSERFRRKGYAAFSYSLKAVGTAILYLSLWAAFQLYHLLPASVALAAMVLVTAWNGFMAWSQDAELLAAYGLVGGLATPLLLSTGGNHETFLFAYVGAIDLALVWLLRSKRWQKLVLPAYAATVGYFIGWYAEWFHSSGGTMDGQSWETALFALVFWAVFAVVSVRGFRQGEADAREVIVPVLLPLAGAAFVSLALYSVLQDSGLHELLAWEMVALAAVYLGLTRMQAAAVSSAMHLAMAVVFLTIAIPLKASGHTLTTAWLIEGLVLYWAATRVQAESGAPAKVLGWLAAGGSGLGLLSLWFHWTFRLGAAQGFVNNDLGAALVAVGTLGGVAWLAAEETRRDRGALGLALLGVDLVAVLLTSREVVTGYAGHGLHPAFANAEFSTALVGLAVLAVVSWRAWWLGASQPTLASRGWGTHDLEEGGLQDLRVLAGGSLIAFNLLTILSVEREIGALWTRAEADLQRSLAISGFLMLYGAVLLAAGFWRRSAFVRWQALVLLLFTIGKVFLYDISGLSQGYRVASFLALGALLMAVSFAYQKDWLGLKQGESR